MALKAGEYTVGGWTKNEANGNVTAIKDFRLVLREDGTLEGSGVYSSAAPAQWKGTWASDCLTVGETYKGGADKNRYQGRAEAKVGVVAVVGRYTCKNHSAKGTFEFVLVAMSPSKETLAIAEPKVALTSADSSPAGSDNEAEKPSDSATEAAVPPTNVGDESPDSSDTESDTPEPDAVPKTDKGSEPADGGDSSDSDLEPPPPQAAPESSIPDTSVYHKTYNIIEPKELSAKEKHELLRWYTASDRMPSTSTSAWTESKQLDSTSEKTTGASAIFTFANQPTAIFTPTQASKSNTAPTNVPLVYGPELVKGELFSAAPAAKEHKVTPIVGRAYSFSTNGPLEITGASTAVAPQASAISYKGKDGNCGPDVIASLGPSDPGMPGSHGSPGKHVNIFLSQTNGKTVTVGPGTDQSIVSGDAPGVLLVDASGGIGGAGGDGRKGIVGQGGNGGPGGFVRFIAADPRLFILVNPRVNGGNPGNGSVKGQIGEMGQVEFQVVDLASDRVLEQSPLLYNLNLTHFEITKAIPDQIYQPEDEIAVSKVTVVNSGGICLPAGATFTFASSATIEWSTSPATLPAILPGQSYEVPEVFKGKIRTPHVRKPLSKAFSSTATFTSAANLLSRPLNGANFTSKLDVSYPIQITDHDTPKSFVLSDTTYVSVKIKNYSTAIYGNTAKMGVFLRFYLDARATEDQPYLRSHESQMVYFDTYVTDLAPSEERVISHHFKTKPEGIPDFGKFKWRVELVLNGRAIQSNHGTIDVVSGWVQGAQSKAVLFTGRFMSQTQYLAWKKLLELLHLTPFKVWDVEYHNGYSGKSSDGRPLSLNDAPNGVPDGAVWIFPYTRNFATQTGLPAFEIIQHFKSYRSATNFAHTPKDPHPDPSGVVLFGFDRIPTFRSILHACPAEDASNLWKDTFYVSSPTYEAAHTLAWKGIRGKNKRTPTHSTLDSLKYDPQGSTDVTFGRLTLRHTPFVRQVPIHTNGDATYDSLVSYIHSGASNLWKDENSIIVVSTIVHAMAIRDRLNLLRYEQLSTWLFRATVPEYVVVYLDRAVWLTKALSKRAGAQISEFLGISDAQKDFFLCLLDFLCLSLYESLKTDFAIYTEAKTYPHLNGLVWACQQEAEAWSQSIDVLTVISFALKQVQDFAQVGSGGIVRDARSAIKKALFGQHSDRQAKFYEPASEASKAKVDKFDGLLGVHLFLHQPGTYLLSGLTLNPGNQAKAK